MKKITFSAIVALFILNLVSACKKDDSPKDILTSVSCWQLVKQESRSQSSDPWSTTFGVFACRADNCISFSSDNTFVEDEGATTCDSTDQQTTTATFSLSEDGKTLTFLRYGFMQTATVEELTSSKLVVTFTFVEQNKLTFEAQ